ncbi:hypothetical protein GCM10023196_017020 [Actinoallomurus vinaceus]|uniref:Uncharacterized protein n=1 Tax=Actinoallomurus vinaceus TaxID=1080074 RepID=A0ABP8U6J7_9ACTN
MSSGTSIISCAATAANSRAGRLERSRPVNRTFHRKPSELPSYSSVARSRSMSRNADARSSGIMATRLSASSNGSGSGEVSVSRAIDSAVDSGA